MAHEPTSTLNLSTESVFGPAQGIKWRIGRSPWIELVDKVVSN